MDLEHARQIVQQCEADLRRHQIRRAPVPAIRMPTIPSARYNDPRMFNLEMNCVFGKSWLFAGMTDEVATAGSYKLWQRLGDRILLVKGKDGQVRAFHNTCRHRGSSLVKAERGRIGASTCRYHGWVYDLEGHLKGVPEEEDFIDLDKEQLSLVPVRCERWGNMIFINKDMRAKSLVECLGALARDFADNQFDQRRAFHSIDFEMACNWKLAADAFNETYHVEQAHPETVLRFMEPRGNHIRLYDNGHSVLYTLKKNVGEADPLGVSDSLLEQRTELEIFRHTSPQYTVFPNLQASTGAYQYALLLFWPTSIRTTTVQAVFTAPKGHDDINSRECQALIQGYEAAIPEDKVNCEAIQQSIDSLPHLQWNVSYSERRLYHFAEAIDRSIGIQNIPQELRIPHALSVAAASS